MRFVDEPVEVDVHIDAQGEARPTAFTWRKRAYPITGIERTYTQEDDHYFLVMSWGERIFELRWHRPDNRWFICRAPGRQDLV